jgi:glycosyltransferase involved in cell wall biosynthesis
MNTKPLVSVVMPSYNQARFIREAIDSVLSQDYSVSELLVMDGGSTDGTVDILRSYGDRIAFVSQRDKGQSDAINQGLSRVRGDIVCWLNSDDSFTPLTLAKIVRAFSENPQTEFVYGRGWNTDESGNITSDSGVLPFNLWKLIHQRNFIHQPSCFFKNSLIKKVGLIDETLHYVMDWELWIRFAAYQGMYIDEHLSNNRTYSENKTQSGQFRRWQEIRRMVLQYTQMKSPPVLSIYFLEAILQALRARSIPHLVEWPIYRSFGWGISREMSGWYSDGSVEQIFHFSVGNPKGKSSAILSFTPLSFYDKSRFDHGPITISWRSSSGCQGTFLLLENSRLQHVTLPLGEQTIRGFVHFRCQANYIGQHVEAACGLPARRIVGFLDRIEV